MYSFYQCDKFTKNLDNIYQNKWLKIFYSQAGTQTNRCKMHTLRTACNNRAERDAV